MKQIHVAAAIIIQEQSILIAQRKDSGELARKWEFPGGKLEEGESGEQAIAREIREELSLEISVERHFMQVSHQYSTFHLTMDAYLCRMKSGEITLSEHLDSRWITPEQLMQPDWAAADIPIAEELQTYLKERA